MFGSISDRDWKTGNKIYFILGLKDLLLLQNKQTCWEFVFFFLKVKPS